MVEKKSRGKKQQVKGSKKKAVEKEEKVIGSEPKKDDYGIIETQDDSDSESEFSGLELEGENSRTSKHEEEEDIIPLGDDKFEEHLPLVNSTNEKIKKKTKKGEDQERGVIYLGHIPYGFFEEQMRNFFSQFGEITQLRLARNKRTGNSKHYAFIEFSSKEVAKIVSEAMNNYMMFGRTLVSQYIPAEEVHANLFKNANRSFKKIPWRKIERDVFNRDRSTKEQAKRVKNLLKKDEKRKQKLQDLGIDYEFDGYAKNASQKPKRVKL